MLYCNKSFPTPESEIHFILKCFNILPFAVSPFYGSDFCVLYAWLYWLLSFLRNSDLLLFLLVIVLIRTAQVGRQQLRGKGASPATPSSFLSKIIPNVPALFCHLSSPSLLPWACPSSQPCFPHCPLDVSGLFLPETAGCKAQSSGRLWWVRQEGPSLFWAFPCFWTWSVLK